MAEFFFHIKDNKITNPRIFRNAVDDLVDGSYRCRIEKGNKRSLNQNAFYWGCVVLIVRDGLRDAGYSEVKTLGDAHEILKALFLKRKMISEKNGDEITIAGSTQKLTTIEFMTYIDEITRWASEYLGVVIPEPGQQMEFFNQSNY